MGTRGDDPVGLRQGSQLASEGVGPLIQRDYWCVVRDSRMRPPVVVSYLRRHGWTSGASMPTGPMP
jgi:hypothetical protein